MCGLCGLLGEDLHWSDPLGDELPRRRERLRRIAAINQVLAVFRLKVEDFQGASYLLMGATGKQALASGLTSGRRQKACSAARWTRLTRACLITWSRHEHRPQRHHRLPWRW